MTWWLWWQELEDRRWNNEDDGFSVFEYKDEAGEEMEGFDSVEWSSIFLYLPRNGKGMISKYYS